METSPTHTDYLDPAALSAIRSLELRARQAVEGVMTGMHRSPFQGVSVDFAQHRPYVGGDDTRFVDWKIYGKTDKLYIKQYQKDTNLDLQLFVDGSGSMGFGSREVAGVVWRKYDYAATVGAAMGYLSLHQQDRVALTIFNRETRPATRLSSHRGHWRSIVAALENSEVDVHVEPDEKPSGEPSGGSSGGGDLQRMFDHAAARLARPSLVVLVSDLFDAPSVLERGLAQLRHHRHDVIVIQVLDPAELTFTDRRGSEFIGLEAEGRLPVAPAALRKYYLEAIERHLEAVEKLTRRFRFDYLRLTSDQPLSAALSLFLATRAAAIAKGRGVKTA